MSFMRSVADQELRSSRNLMMERLLADAERSRSGIAL